MQARSSSMIPPGGEVKTSVLNDLIELLLISRAMYGGISIFIVAISIFFFSCFGVLYYNYSSKETGGINEYCNVLSVFTVASAWSEWICIFTTHYVHVSYLHNLNNWD